MLQFRQCFVSSQAQQAYRELGLAFFARISRILLLALFFMSKEKKFGREFDLALLARVEVITFMMVSYMPK